MQAGSAAQYHKGGPVKRKKTGPEGPDFAWQHPKQTSSVDYFK